MKTLPPYVIVLFLIVAISSAALYLVQNVAADTIVRVGIPDYLQISLSARDFLRVLLVVTFLLLIVLFALISERFRTALVTFFLNVIEAMPLFGSGIVSGLSASSEILRVEATESLSSVRRRIEAEKNEEMIQALKSLEAELEKRLRASQDRGVLDESGKIAFDAGGVLGLGRDRLIRETERLQARSRANLTYGILISLLAVIFLGATIFVWPVPISEGTTFSDFAIGFLPRLAVFVLVQVLGAFFLRLYVANESDIKQNKNEITNMELKLSSYLAIDGDKRATAVWSSTMANNERNFILKKDEKVAGEAWRTEAEDLRGILTKLLDKLKVSEAPK